MPEVNGDGTYIVNPTSVDDVKDAIERLLQWENWQAEVSRGLENVKRFEPSKIAKKYLALYKEIEQSK
jgi:glycosyltransferase involved in cell wall biosynthesis